VEPSFFYFVVLEVDEHRFAGMHTRDTREKADVLNKAH
jgi:hypothetical protein